MSVRPAFPMPPRRFLSAILAGWLALVIPAAANRVEAAEAGQAAPAAVEGASESTDQEKARLVQAQRDTEIIHHADSAIQDSLPHPLAALLGEMFFGIPIWRYLAGLALAAGSVFLSLLIGRRLRKKLLEVEADKNPASWQRLLDILVLAARNPAKLIILALTLRWLSALAVTSFHADAVWFSNLLLVLAVAAYFYDLTGLADRKYGGRVFPDGDRLLATVRPIAAKFIRAVIVIAAGMQIYQSATGQTMLSLLAGLGIGGLALALASQETLKNLIGFASIALDKAFLVGDSVTIAGFDGTVERVGLRSLRLAAGDGSSVVIPNATAINSSLVNRSRRQRVRLEIRLHASLANPFPLIEKALDELKTIMAGLEGGAPGFPPEARLAAFEPGKIVIQAVFWFDPRHPGIQAETDRLHLEIGRRLSGLGIVFA
jgi:MscS family membrane protein